MGDHLPAEERVDERRDGTDLHLVIIVDVDGDDLKWKARRRWPSAVFKGQSVIIGNHHRGSR